MSRTIDEFCIKLNNLAVDRLPLIGVMYTLLTIGGTFEFVVKN